MSAAGFIEFFILEASDYVEKLDALLLGGAAVGPDGESMQRTARALRGTATMAKLTSFADLAAGVERVGRALQDGMLRWEPALAGAVVAAIDDLKTLLHAVRTWSPADDQRARTRTSELARFAPPRPTPTGVSTVGGNTTSNFLATEAANIAAGLELLTARAGDSDTAANVLRRIRALRGVAGVKEIGPLADVLEATEDAARGLELSRAELTADARKLLEAAAGYLRTLSAAMRAGGDVHAPNPTRDAFENARAAMETSSTSREQVVPIAELFYEDGAGLVETSQHPPTTATERFRLELVSLGEHLRQVLHSARQAGDVSSPPRVEREIRRALQALEAAAESFGEHEISGFIRAQNRALTNVDFLSLSGLEDLASALTEPGLQGDRLRTRLRDLAGGRDLATAIGAGFGRSTPPAPAPRAATPPAAQAPARRPSPVTAPTIAPVAAPAAAAAAAAAPAPAVAVPEPATAPPAAPARAPEPSLLDRGIASLDSFSARRHLTPAPIPEDDDSHLVPIESLLYRGRAALDRAAELRDSIKQGSGGNDPDVLDELFDLIELARVE